MTITTINPATEQVIQTYQEMSNTEVLHKIEASHQAFLNWCSSTFKERAEKMRRVAKILLDEINYFAELITIEMGKPITSSRAEIRKCAKLCDYYAEHAKDYLAPRIIQTEFTKSYVKYDSLGVVFAIMPWNFPFWQVLRFAVPDLMAGNGALLKHSSNTTGVAIAIEELFKKAEFPKNLFSTLIINTSVVKDVIQHPFVVGVTLTGSARVGSVVGAQAGKALKKVVLELGGSDPYIVLEDADLNQAAKICVKSRLANAGQVCIAAKRLIVVKSIQKAFEEEVIKAVEQYRVGDPLNEATDMGPLARSDLRDTLDQQVEQSIQQGAKLIYRAAIQENPGYYYAPTVLSQVQKGAAACKEELFGPVISIIPVKNEQEAVALANDSQYGLGAVVFTNDLEKGERIAANQLQAGSCCVNMSVFSDPRFPFGGIKSSGFGRELSEEGIREFVNVKTVHVR